MDLAHDEAHKATDKTIAQLERRIQKVYKEAQMDLTAKARQFFDKFEVKAQALRKQVEAGEITEAQYQAWLRGQVFQGKQWQAKLAQITATLTHADEVAQNIINGEVYGVFANNANWISYMMDNGAGLDFGFEMYDASTVRRLLQRNPQLLPKYRLDIPKDKRWNQSLITRQITQGIIQGENIFQIAKRMEKCTDQDRNLSLTRARTAMTGAQNAGRRDTMVRANNMGIKLKKQWLATLDLHTRTSHRRLDGVSVPIKAKFQGELGEIEYPGDPKAPAGEVYNCRCTMIADLLDYPDKDADGVQRRDNIEGKPIKDMTYAEWYKAKTGKDLPRPKKRRAQPPKPAPKPATKKTTQKQQKKPEKALQLQGIRDKLDAQFVDNMQAILEKAENPNLRKMYFKFGDRIRVIDAKCKKGAYFSRWDEGVHFNQKSVALGGRLDMPYETAFHEFGHNIDWLASPGRHNYFSLTYKNGLLDRLIKSDYQDFMQKEGFDNATALVYSLKRENMDRRTLGNLSDILEGCTGISYPLGVGHGADYHQHTGATAKEFFAEVCDSAATNPGSLAQMRRVWPNAVALVEEMMEVLAK